MDAVGRGKKSAELTRRTLPVIPQPDVQKHQRSSAAMAQPAATTTTTTIPQISFEEPSSSRRQSRNNDHFEQKIRSKDQQQQQLPNIVLNDKQRSTSYRRLAKSDDFEKVKSSPLATRFVYNWKPNERSPTRVVQAKVKVYKPPKRIEMTGRPSSPYRLCVDYETKDSHAHNYERTMDMKRLKYLREHTEWSIYPYAGIEEREEYK